MADDNLRDVSINANTAAIAGKTTSAAAAAAAAALIATEHDTERAYQSSTYLSGTIDTNYATLELALAAIAVGGTLEVRGNWSRVLPFTVDKTCTVKFSRGASITTTVASAAGLRVVANDVVLDAPRVFGTGSATADTGTGITAVGTVGAPVTGMRIRAPKVQDFTKYGILLEQCADFAIDKPRIDNIAYAGIMMLSCIGGNIDGGTVKNIVQPSGFTNSYGIAMTRDSSVDLTTAPRSSGITVNAVTVDGVPLWEGIDTHGGQNITITNNKVFNTFTGIALVSCPDPGAVNTYAATGIVCTGNTVDAKVSDGSRGVGINLAGNAIEAANAIISGNTVIDHGSQATLASSGAILADYTRGAVIAGNTIIRPGGSGIMVYSFNTGLIVAGNTIEDTWTDGQALTGSVFVRSTNNTLTVSGTRITRGAKTATLVNDRGLHIGTPTANVVIDGGGNDWTGTTTPVNGGTLVLKAGVYGATPVVRAAAVTAPTAPSAAYVQAEAAAMKTAVDAIRVALTAFGITS